MIKGDLKESTKDIEEVRCGYEEIKKKATDGCQEVTDELLSDLSDIKEGLIYSNSVQTDEYSFLRNQASQLTQDRIRLQQNFLVLENRILETEKDIGMKEFKF